MVVDVAVGVDVDVNVDVASSGRLNTMLPVVASTLVRASDCVVVEGEVDETEVEGDALGASFVAFAVVLFVGASDGDVGRETPLTKEGLLPAPEFLR